MLFRSAAAAAAAAAANYYYPLDDDNDYDRWLWFVVSVQITPRALLLAQIPTRTIRRVTSVSSVAAIACADSVTEFCASVVFVVAVAVAVAVADSILPEMHL